MGGGGGGDVVNTGSSIQYYDFENCPRTSKILMQCPRFSGFQGVFDVSVSKD